MAREAKSGSRSPRITTTLGSLAVVAAVALSWPGVEVARADSDRAGETEQFERFMAFVGEPAQRVAAPASPDSCAAGQAVQNAEAQAAQALERMKRRIEQARAEARPAGRPGSDDRAPAVMMLNGRGYNYGDGAGPAAEIGRLHQELAQRRGPRS